jgi:hypothetical protein
MTTNLQIQDSGYRQVPTTGAETEVTNSGTAITLKSVSLNVRVGALINDEPTKQYEDDDSTKKFDFGEVDKNGLEFPKWKLDGVLNMNVSSDRTTLAYLYDLTKTKGYKKLLTTDDGDNKIFLRWTNTTPITSINVRIKGFTVKQKAKSDIINYTLNLVETN